MIIEVYCYSCGAEDLLDTENIPPTPHKCPTCGGRADIPLSDDDARSARAAMDQHLAKVRKAGLN